MATNREMNVARLIAQCLENEGVKFIFGLPGEEIIPLVDALNDSAIRFILVRSEQGAAFMAEMYGRVTGKAGVCLATLGPGAINLLLGVADAQTDSTPLVALSAQVGLGRIYKETHQVVDLVSMFKPVTKWSDTLLTPAAVPEMIRHAFNIAQTERPGAVYLALPQDLETMAAPAEAGPLPVHKVLAAAPAPDQIAQAAALLEAAQTPIILAGHGAARHRAQKALVHFSEKLKIPVATTFHGKGVFPDDHPHALGVMGFMVHDYVNFGFDQADVIVSVGYELQEFPPMLLNPQGEPKIIHLHRFPAMVDAYYNVAVEVTGDISAALHDLAARVSPKPGLVDTERQIRCLLREELGRGRRDESFPVKPQRLVADIRAALNREDVVLVDSGAVKMWMARLYPTCQPDTCLVSNGLSTMGFALPGALGAKLAAPDRKVLAVTGDGGFLMNSQEIETALRERIPFVILIWVDGSYGLIKWKMEMQLHRSSQVDFGNPDFVKYAESFGARGYFIQAAGDLLPTLRQALAEDTVSVIACPVDYSENAKLTEKLEHLTEPAKLKCP
ncbi:MAG: acetolactate synthase large subunit [Deltaproteobacteria bacterium]|nr:acetolactate synthase large subunit [Deltaproteobacteria bacterium]